MHELGLLSLYGNIVRNDCIERELGTRQLAIKDSTSKSWFVALQEVLYRYRLPTAYDLLQDPPDKLTSVLPRNFITGDNVPGLLKKWGHLRKKWGHLRKKWGHCGENDGPVIWRSKISLPSVYIITEHTLTVINNLLTN